MVEFSLKLWTMSHYYQRSVSVGGCGFIFVVVAFVCLVVW